MTEASHAIARAFFAALANGAVPDDLLTPDFTAWTTSVGTKPPHDKATYQGGVRLLGSLFNGGLAFTIDSITAEDDRVVAEVQSRGVLVDGTPYHNIYVFVLRLRDGRIAAVAEHFDPRIIDEKVMPLMQAAIAKLRQG